MKVGQLSHKGNVRPQNEDSIYSSMKRDLFIIADGMGGYNGGEIASKAAINKVRHFIKNKYDDINKTQEDILGLICDSIEYTNTYIHSIAQKDETLKGMGTTIITVLIHEDTAYIGHVGDSRAYIISGDNITQVTSDHSLAEELFRKGSITKEEAINYPHRNVITRALGSNKNVDIDTYMVKLKKNDILLLCTDGLTNMVSDQEILRIVKENESPTKGVRQLVEVANQSGGTDNISVIIVKNDN